ncbi:MAG: 2Fe-2S iron-sulfur cluster-binding protein, partial [Xanthobacteraceae bacterium]
MSLVNEIDYGTPRSLSTEMVTLTIDGRSVSAPAGTSIMRAAMDVGVEIPKLCATDMLDAFGSCRLCLIEIEGRAGTPASCTTPVAEGLVVATTSERLDRLRKGVMELYVSDHPVASLDPCQQDDVELLDVAAQVGLTENRYGFDSTRHRNTGLDVSNPYFMYDPEKCIVCSRCVRACNDVQGTFALTITGRGFDSVMAAGSDQSFLESDCVSCGACVQACPTGSLIEKAVVEQGRPD